jgi:hypothetical protein
VPKCTLIRHQKARELILTAGRWPWKSESAKECVTTHRPNQLAAKMDGAQACYLYLPHAVGSPRRGVGGRGGFFAAEKPWERSRVERPLVQILVVVANIQVRTLKAEVGKGSMVTAVGHG